MTLALTFLDHNTALNAEKKRQRQRLDRMVRAICSPIFAQCHPHDRESLVRAFARYAREQSAQYTGEASTVALFGALAHSEIDARASCETIADRVFAR